MAFVMQTKYTNFFAYLIRSVTTHYIRLPIRSFKGNETLRGKKYNLYFCLNKLLLVIHELTRGSIMYFLFVV